MFNKIIIILLAIIIVLLPSIKLFTEFYYSFILVAAILIIIILIVLLKIEFKLKIVIIAIILIIFKNNLSVNGKTVITIINAAYIKPLKTRTDDSKLRTDVVEYSFNKVLLLKKDFLKLPDKPTIFVCNYCSDRIENLACILIPKDIAIMMRDGLKKTVKLDKLVKWPIFTKEKNNYEYTKNEISKHINQGRSVLSYITKYPKLRPNYIPTIRSGLFNISKELNIPITLVAIDYVDIKYGIMFKQNFNIVIGDTFIVENVQDSMYIAKKFYKDMLTSFIQNKYKNI